MPKASDQGTTATPEYHLVMSLVNEFRQCWVEQFTNSGGTDHVKFSQLSVVALTQLAAVLAVDVGMTPEQFTNICRAQFADLHKRAPRFAE
jgi:hypothetical protein